MLHYYVPILQRPKLPRTFNLSDNNQSNLLKLGYNKMPLYPHALISTADEDYNERASTFAEIGLQYVLSVIVTTLLLVRVVKLPLMSFL